MRVQIVHGARWWWRRRWVWRRRVMVRIVVRAGVGDDQDRGDDGRRSKHDAIRIGTRQMDERQHGATKGEAAEAKGRRKEQGMKLRRRLETRHVAVMEHIGKCDRGIERRKSAKGEGQSHDEGVKRQLYALRVRRQRLHEKSA